MRPERRPRPGDSQCGRARTSQTKTSAQRGRAAPTRVRTQVCTSVAYHAPVPVSRKRKKTSKSSRRSRLETSTWRPGSTDQQRELAAAMLGFGEFRRQLDERRASLAAEAATPMIAELIELAAISSDADI